MSLDALSRYNDAEDEIKDEDHDLVLTSTKVVDESPVSQPASDVDSGAENKPIGLVSYGGDYTDDESDDDKDDNDLIGSNHLGSSVESADSPTSGGDNASEIIESTLKKELEYGVKLPSEPEGRCSKTLQEKNIKMFERKNMGLNVNEYVQKKKAFRNPSIYEKLVTYIGIDEHGTNFPKHIYDPAIWGSDSFYDQLAKSQKEYHDKKEKEKRDANRTKVEFVLGTKKPPSAAQTATANNAVPEKKSKWDQGPAKR